MISFIIPTKNEEKSLDQTLKSLALYQGDKEIIISDGKSTDRTIEIAKKYTDLITIYQGEVRQTIAAGRNAGAKLAHGEYLMFLDADVTLQDPDAFFKKALETFKKNKRIVALTVRIKVLPESETFADSFFCGMMDWITFFHNNVTHMGASAGEFMMVKSEAFKQINGFDEMLVAAEDYDLFIRLAKIGRTYFEKNLIAYHTGRRIHKVGWPRLLFSWAMNFVSMLVYKKAAHEEWEEVR